MIQITKSKRITISFIVSLFIFLLFMTINTKVKGQVVINEFQLSPSNEQWIELYNKGEDSENLSGWIIDDNGGSSGVYTIPSDTYLLPNKCLSFKGTFNWNVSSQDIVRLIQPSGVFESYSYLKSPGDYVSIGRIVDGDGDFTILGLQSRDKYNSNGESCLMPVSTPSPLPSPILTPSPTISPTSPKAVYKINQPKDNDGNDLSSVKIYVDGNYTHHEDEEVLQFFDGHKCSSDVLCGLGTHTISLKKDGFSTWEDTQDLLAGVNLEVNPVLDKLSTALPTASPTVSPISTKTPKPTPTKTPSPTDVAASESAVLGIHESFLKTTDPSQEAIQKSEGKAPILPIILVFAGLCFIAIPIFSIIKNGQKSSETHKPLDSSDSLGSNDI